jgi:SRSO17 transposase
VADLASVLGHADRIRPFEDYCVGLLYPPEAKSLVEATGPYAGKPHVRFRAGRSQ